MIQNGLAGRSKFPVSSAALSLSTGINGNLGTIAEDVTTTIATTLQPQTVQIVSKGLDTFIRETEGGKRVLAQISLYAMVPYAAAGFLIGYLLGRR